MSAAWQRKAVLSPFLVTIDLSVFRSQTHAVIDARNSRTSLITNLYFTIIDVLSTILRTRHKRRTAAYWQICSSSSRPNSRY